MSREIKKERTTSNHRIAFDDALCQNTSIDNMAMAIRTPQESEHWQSLVHKEGDRYIHNLEELKARFRSDVLASGNENETNSGEHPTDNGGELMAIWSCLSGYCEALATHKEAHRRYFIFPIPMDALERLVRTEFWARVLDPAEDTRGTLGTTLAPGNLRAHQEEHRARVRAVANAVWDTAVSSTKKDEEHANSLYVCLRGSIDRKSIDCLGSSVTTVAGVKLLQARELQRRQQCESHPQNARPIVTSMLTLSEDHAYERHTIRVPGDNDDATSTAIVEGTCEVAIPGSTKRQKAKRACEIADTFKDKKACVLLTPESSWLYMAKNPVVCTTTHMSLVPIIANINCNIRSKSPGSSGSSGGSGSSLESRQLFRLKRELLWILYDAGAMQAFPFGILELGDCEGTVGSARGEEWVHSKSPLVQHGEPILKNEELFLEAIGICKERYRDAQVYPYYYAGHYHKDAGGTNAETEPDSNEHRFVDALKMYAEAARVTSGYRFDTGDCLQLNKHMTAMAAFLYEDILTEPNHDSSASTNRAQPPISRAWKVTSNSQRCCFWLLRFLDHLLQWEESSLKASSAAGITSKNPRFVEILQPSHKHFVGKLLQTFGVEVRTLALDKFFQGLEPATSGTNYPQPQPTGFSTRPLSKRLGNGNTLLAQSLQKPKLQIRDLELAILDEDDEENGGGRRGRSSKRRKRS